MNDVVRFEGTVLKDTGKAGIITPDATGYYTMCVGGLNLLNSAGEFYVVKGARELFSSSGAFMRRVKGGTLRGEADHPQPYPGETQSAYLNRILDINPKRVCVHFRAIWLDFSLWEKNPTAPVRIMAELTPSGELGHVLEKSLKNSYENVHFSIRSFTKNQNYAGRVNKELINIVTFDNVGEGGISLANKWSSPTLESLSPTTFTKEQVLTTYKTSTGILGLENRANEAHDICSAMNWQLPKGTTAILTKW